MKSSTLFSLASAVAFASASPVFPAHSHNGHNGTFSNSTCTSMNQRKAWHTLENQEKSDYLQAVKCLFESPAKTGIKGAKTRWDELQSCHVEQSNFIHGVGAFLPWHRLFLRLHEILLQEECGYTGALPYWDEQRDLEVFGTVEKASVWGSDEFSFGTNGVNTTQGTNCVIDGPFANTTLRMDQVYGIDYYDEYCLSREFNQTAFTFANQSYVDECYVKETYNEANFCYVDSPHSCGHLATGGTMENQNASPGDPIFFLHHANLDRLWWDWQLANLSSRLTDMSGQLIPPTFIMEQNRWLTPSAAYLDYDGDAGNDTTLNHVLWMAEIIPNKTIADVMDLRSELLCTEYIVAEK
ncbi:amino acid transporter [Colletotrichum nymphaeae SA-01]|uniref:Amino acid transporter n=1 Tax=Colletotrichum nymphaeae SA-01 TaxID=1460502 RepID=A0A135UYD8_9PEZI|nr:amino acid transporter [Colletotrichum nymphaeae SA-01]